MPDVCWSVATSRSIGSDLSFSSTFGAHSFSSSRLASCSVYWNCVRAIRPPTLTSCAACMKSRAPSTFSSCGRSRAITCPAETSRSLLGFSVMKKRPLLSVELEPPAPMAMA